MSDHAKTTAPKTHPERENEGVKMSGCRKPILVWMSLPTAEDSDMCTLCDPHEKCYQIPVAVTVSACEGEGVWPHEEQREETGDM